MAEAPKAPPKDEKKDEGKKPEKNSSFFAWELSGGAIIFIVILMIALIRKYSLAGSPNLVQLSSNYVSSHISESVFSTARALVFSYVVLANILSLFFVIGLVFVLIKMREVEKKWYNQYYPGPLPEESTKPKNEKWQRVLTHIGSSNASDWRLAVLEADIILDELLDQLGYVGDTIGDKLKKAVSGNFKTLDQAWEAHKIRNAIAHEGQDFELSQREAQRIIGLYQDVFQEFDYI